MFPHTNVTSSSTRAWLLSQHHPDEHRAICSAAASTPKPGHAADKRASDSADVAAAHTAGEHAEHATTIDQHHRRRADKRAHRDVTNTAGARQTNRHPATTYAAADGRTDAASQISSRLSALARQGDHIDTQFSSGRVVFLDSSGAEITPGNVELVFISNDDGQQQARSATEAAAAFVLKRGTYTIRATRAQQLVIEQRGIAVSGPSFQIFLTLDN